MLLGSIVGGTVAVYLASLFLEWALFRRVTDSAAVGIPASVIAAAAIGVVLYGFGSANGGQWNPFPGGIGYIVAAFIVIPLRLRAYHKRQERESSDSDLEDVFK